MDFMVIQANESWLYAAGARVRRRPHKNKKSKQNVIHNFKIIHCILPRPTNIKNSSMWACLDHNAWFYRRIFPVGDLGKMQWIIDNLFSFLSLFILFLWGRRRTLAPAAYSHDSMAKQWPRYCEPPGSKPCQCAILVPFYEALIPITVSYDLRTYVP